MTDFANFPVRDSGGTLVAIVETPRGSRVKYEFDPILRVFTISKFLSLGLAYPFDFGFFPSTKAEDGDPLDVILVHEAGTFSGLVMKVRLIGALGMDQTKAGKTVRNDRLVAVPFQAERDKSLTDVRGLDPAVRKQIEMFLRATDELEDKTVNFRGWKGPRAAEKLLAKATARHFSSGPGAGK